MSGSSVSKLPFDFSEIRNSDSIGLKPKYQKEALLILRGVGASQNSHFYLPKIFINFGTLFPDTITKLFKRVNTEILEKGPWENGCVVYITNKETFIKTPH